MLQLTDNGEILIDGHRTGLNLAQRRDDTVIYTPESVISGRKYQEHKMPFGRYSAAHDAPSKPGETHNPSVSAGRGQLEADVRALLSTGGTK